MNDILAAGFLVLLLSGLALLLEHNHRRTAGAPYPPFGADPEGDADLWRLRHDLDAAGVSRPVRAGRPDDRRSRPTRPVHRARVA